MNTQIILNTNPYITAKYVVPSPLFPLGLTDSEMSMKTFEILIGKIVYAENLINEYLTFGIHTEISFSYQHNLNDALIDFLHVLKKFPQLKK